MLRALGAGFRVYYLRMLKPKWKTGELNILPDLHPNLTFKNVDHPWKLTISKTIPEEVALMTELLKPDMVELKNIVASGKYDMVIVDEINYCIHRGVVSLEDAINIIDSRPEKVELVFTGRYAKPEIVERADLVTEMTKIKHYFDKGLKARLGIEF